MKILTALLAATLLLAGCGSSESDDASPAEPSASTSAPASEPTQDAGSVVKIVIADGAVTPRGGRVEVTAGDTVTLQISSDAEEEIHVHSEPEHEYEVGPGDTVKSFTLDTPGQVAVEAHHLDATIVQLVVRP